MVFLELVTACLFANNPTSRSPFLLKDTTDGVVLLPSLFSITTGCPPSITETTEFVVPKSMPIALAIISFLLKSNHYYYHYFFYYYLLNFQSYPFHYHCLYLFSPWILLRLM